MIAIENDILRNYIDRIYGFCIRQTYNREEADELSQEILYTALKQLPTLQEEAKFEAWLWGLAANVTRVYRRKQGKQRAMYSFDTLENVAYEEDYTAIDEDLRNWVRSKIAQLSKIYRDMIVFYYYDNLSCKEIAERLQIPEGTVTWRLSKARNKLKKECVIMEETALRPIAMGIGIHGSGNYNGKDIPFPQTFINDALSQNILFHCYEEPQTVEDLSKLCGVPAFYIEDAVRNLLNREAAVEQLQGKYRTNFLIYGEKHQKYNDNTGALAPGSQKNSYACLQILPGK